MTLANLTVNAQTLYIVTYEVGGYCREDPSQTRVAGAFTDKDLADKVRMAVSGKVEPVVLNAVAPGYVSTMQAFGVDTAKFGL